MPVTIRKVKADANKITRRILVYGDSGSGKTHLVGTAQDVPQMKSVLVANIDKGVTTLLSRGDVDAADISSAADLEELLWMLVRKDPAVAHIGTLAIDGGSELQKIDLAQIALDASKKQEKRDQDINQLNDYMQNKNRLLRVLRMARDIPGINVILTCWATKDYPKVPGTQQQNKDAKPTLICPDMPDAIRRTLSGFMDDIFYMAYDPESDKRYMYTGNFGPVVAKCRDQAVAEQLQTDGKPYLINPTFGTIYNAYQRAYAQEKNK
jgi:hypothetical protein